MKEKKTLKDRLAGAGEALGKVSEAGKQMKDSKIVEKITQGAKNGAEEIAKGAKIGAGKVAAGAKGGAGKIVAGAKSGSEAIKSTVDEMTGQPMIIDGHTVIRVKGNKFKILIPDGYARVEDKKVIRLLQDSFDIKKIETAYALPLQNSFNVIALFMGDTKTIRNPQDLQGLIDRIHTGLAENQGIIEAKNGKTKRGYDYIYSIVKSHISQDGMPGGVNYFLRLNLFTEKTGLEIYGSFEEQGMTGMRDSTIYSVACSQGLCEFGGEGWNIDPYDPTYEKGNRMNLSEKEGIDCMFPEHPLSMAREFLYAVLNDELIGIMGEPEETKDAKEDKPKSSVKISDLLVDACIRETYTVEIEKAEKSADKKGEKESKDGKERLDDQLHDAITRYNSEYAVFEDSGAEILRLRERSVDLLENVENLINTIANHPKSFDVDFEEIHIHKKEFKDVCDFAKRELDAAKKSAAGVGAGVAGGMAVASLAPSAAMWVATTFGTASTGTAISALSGAAAQSAALAWLGGGTLAAGGGGMSAGTALLALAGPVGWSIGGATLLASIALFANKKIKLGKERKEEIEAVLRNIESLREMNTKIKALVDKTDTLRSKLSSQYNDCLADYGKNYMEIEPDRQMLLGALVNNAKSLAATLGEVVEG